MFYLEYTGKVATLIPHVGLTKYPLIPVGSRMIIVSESEEHRDYVLRGYTSMRPAELNDEELKILAIYQEQKDAEARARDEESLRKKLIYKAQAARITAEAASANVRETKVQLSRLEAEANRTAAAARVAAKEAKLPEKKAPVEAEAPGLPESGDSSPETRKKVTSAPKKKKAKKG